MLCLVLWVVCTCLAIAVSAADSPYDYEPLKTEPTFFVPKLIFLNITKDESLLQPGSYFIDFKDEDVVQRWSPLIYDDKGELVWYGRSPLNSSAFRTQNFHPCDFHGKQDALCLAEVFRRSKDFPDKHAFNKIFDSSYESVGPNHTVVSGLNWSNQHEFQTVNSTSYYTSVYNPIRSNLKSVGGKKNGRMEDCCVQHVDTVTNKETFRWCVLGDAKVKESEPSFFNIPQNGRLYDVWHMNGIDINEEGDYLVSVRNLNQVFKVAGVHAQEVHGVAPGTVLWRLGGVESDFEMDAQTKFTMAHDARYLNMTKDETTISIFDNHWLSDLSRPPSSCKILKINNSTMTVSLVKEYLHPERMHSAAMGSARVLPNGNVLVGWGRRAQFTEYSADGEILLHATWAKESAGAKSLYNYRVTKAPWKGTPKSSPKLVVYSQQCKDAPVYAYVSWNGATDVHSWRFSAADPSGSDTGKNKILGTFNRTGFETRVQLENVDLPTTRNISVEALDDQGKVLSSTTSSASVPKRPGANKCDEYGCSKPPFFNYATMPSIDCTAGLGFHAAEPASYSSNGYSSTVSSSSHAASSSYMSAEPVSFSGAPSVDPVSRSAGPEPVTSTKPSTTATGISSVDSPSALYAYQTAYPSKINPQLMESSNPTSNPTESPNLSEWDDHLTRLFVLALLLIGIESGTYLYCLLFRHMPARNTQNHLPLTRRFHDPYQAVTGIEDEVEKFRDSNERRRVSGEG